MELVKKIFFGLTLVLTFIAALSCVTASCITIHLTQKEFLPKETLQAEINAQLTRDLTTNDIFLYRGSYMLPQVFFMTKVSANKYFFWTNLPSVESNYLLKVRGYCGNELSFSQEELEIKKPIATLYESLPKENFKSLSLEEHILVALARPFDAETRSKAEQEFIARNDSCYSKECTVKHYAFSALAFQTIREKMLDNLIARQNSLNSNSFWFLSIDSEPQNCTLNISSENQTTEKQLELQGKQNITLTLDSFKEEKNIEIKLNCTSSVNASLVYRYKNIEKILETKQSSSPSFSINNEGCWGTGFKNACDEESTVYAVLALKYLGKEISNSTIEWLKNKEKIMTKSIYYFLTKDNETFNFLLASEMFSGGWPRVLGSYVVDIPTTSITYFVIAREKDLKKTESRLLNLFPTLSAAEKSFVLFFVFSPEKIEPILSFWPGMVKTKSQDSFNLILKNEGSENITLETTFLNFSTSSRLQKGSIKNFNVRVPKITTPTGEAIVSNFEIKATTDFGGTRVYVVPVLIFTEKGLEATTGQVNLTEKEINKTQEQEIINATQNQSLQNETANISDNLLQKKFRFIETFVNRTITTKENFTITIRIVNQYDKDIEQVTIISTPGLIGILTLEPSFFTKIAKNEQKQITLKVEPKFSGIYSGTLIAQGKLNGQSISTNISIFFNVMLNETLSCSEMNGTDCVAKNLKCVGEEVKASDTFYCCLGKCEKEKKSNVLPIIIIIAIITLLLTAYMILKRKPKKEMRDILEEVEKKYRQPKFEHFEEKEFEESEEI
ncbi:MAG: hypothetical protein QXQ82_01495 [Candidatus Pacearchaeota archaeon]